MSHTKGPWVADETEDAFFIGKDAETICIVEKLYKRELEQIANARIIEAAPEMLDLLAEVSINASMPPCLAKDVIDLIRKINPGWK